MHASVAQDQKHGTEHREANSVFPQREYIEAK